MNRVEDFRHRADEADQTATRVQDREIARTFRDIAAAYRELAGIIERNALGKGEQRPELH